MKLFLTRGHRKKLFAASAHILLHIYERCNIRWSVLSGVVSEAHPVALNETQLVCWWWGCDAALPSGLHMKKRCCPRLQLSHLNENTIALVCPSLCVSVCLCVMICDGVIKFLLSVPESKSSTQETEGETLEEEKGGLKLIGLIIKS